MFFDGQDLRVVWDNGRPDATGPCKDGKGSLHFPDDTIHHFEWDGKSKILKWSNNT